MTDTFSTHSRSVLIDLLSGVSEADAATKHGISERTIQRWLRKGRDDPSGRYGEFATIIDQARIEGELPPKDERPVDEQELLLLASRFGRRGNVRALQLAREILAERRRPKDRSAFDELDDRTEFPPQLERRQALGTNRGLA